MAAKSEKAKSEKTCGLDNFDASVKAAANRKAERDTFIKKIKRGTLYKTIRKDLMDQLARSGTVGKHYEDLIDDYMDMWITKQELVRDIQERGVMVDVYNAAGFCNQKKNESVELRIKVNGQMLKLLAELDIEPSQAAGEDDAL